MSIRLLVTRGYGNGTFDGTISQVVTRGYAESVAGTVTGSGDLESLLAELDGTGERVLTAIGSMESLVASIDGTGLVVPFIPTHTGSGTLSSLLADLEGTGARGVIGSGSLEASLATISGTGERLVKGIGDLTSALADLNGVGLVVPLVPIHTGSGSLLSTQAVISGTAERIIKAIGSLDSQLAALSGSGTVLRVVTGSGNLSSELATIVGTTAGLHIGIGALRSELATLSGLGFVLTDSPPTASRTSASSNSATAFNLGNVPQVDDYQTYEALLEVHAAIEALATRLDDIETGLIANLSESENYMVAQLNVKTVAVSYGIQIGDGTILTRARSSNLSITLPTAAGVSGTEYTIKQVLGATYSTYIVPATGESIDSLEDILEISLDQSVTLKSDGVVWWIL